MKNSKLTREQKDKWLGVVSNDTMSSEESGPDDDIIVHSLPWRSRYVNKMFSKIDRYIASKKSPQALRQMKSRKLGTPSERPVPDVDKYPQWVIEA